MVVIDEWWEDPVFRNFINNPDATLKQLALIFNYLKYVGYSDDDIIEAVSKILSQVPSDRIMDYSAKVDSNE